MSRNNIIFDDENINKGGFYKNKSLFNIYGIDVNKKLVSRKKPHGKKSSFEYFIGYSDNDDIRPLCIKLRHMRRYVKCLDSNKVISFKFIDKKLLKNIPKRGKELAV